MIRRAFAVFVVHLLSLPTTAHADGALAGFDAFVEEVMAEWQVPGMVVGAVRGDDVILARPYGFVDEDGTLPVTERTLFHLGSITKSFTVTGLGMLADEGRLDWDATVRTYLPEFELVDPRATRDVTVRQLVTHTSGLPCHDVLWYADTFNREQLIRRLRYLKLTESPGTRFQYNNLMFMVAGAVAGRVAGTSRKDFTRERVLKPLDMSDTRLSIAGFRSAGDIAQPYILNSTGRVPVDLRDTDAIAPAGGVYSNLADMIRYLRFHLNKGRVEERTLIRRNTVEELHTGVIGASDDLKFNELSISRYDMGFFVTRYRGERLVHHPGVINGYKGRLSLVLDCDLGIVVLSNLSGSNRAPTIVTFALIDRLLGLEPIDWPARFRTVGRADRERTFARKKRAKRETLRPRDPAPPAYALADYAGRYVHPGYGSIDIAVDVNIRNRLTGSFNGKVFSLVHVNGEIWRVAKATWPIRRRLKVTFADDGDGKVGALKAAVADGPTYRFTVGDVTFRKIGS